MKWWPSILAKNSGGEAMKSKRRSKSELAENARMQGYWDSQGLKARRRLQELPVGASDQEIAEAIADWEIGDFLGCFYGSGLCLNTGGDRSELFETNSVEDARAWFVARALEGKRVFVGSGPKSSCWSNTTLAEERERIQGRAA